MKIYIRSAACISPQKTFGNSKFLEDVFEYKGTWLKAFEPDYTIIFESKVIRRMSRLIKMAVTAAQECLNISKVSMPGAIITGTAYGSIEDTAYFLKQITSFIQSTHNSIAAQVALMLKCHSYNITFVHKGNSFESAMLDAFLLLKEKETDDILVGGTDEMTDASFAILSRLGLYKRKPISNLNIFETYTKGSIGGEGAAFFLLTAKESKDNLVEFVSVFTFYKPKDQIKIEENITSFLIKHFLHIGEIDLIICGKNGDIKNDKIYSELADSLFHNNEMVNYKHLCGEYPTSTSFALWLASNIIAKGFIPATVRKQGKSKSRPKNILIYNHYYNIYHSLFLVSAC